MRLVRANSRGFSLAELLTVLGIIGVLVTLAAPALKGISESGTMTQALTRIGGTLDAARNYAVANNTHAWVAFTANAIPGESGVRMVAFASRTGLDLDSAAGGEVIEYPSDDVELISPIETIRQIRLDGTIPEDNALRTSQELPSVAELTEFPDTDGGLQMRLQEKNYTRSIHFKPTGEAGITPAMPEAIQMVVVPEKAAGGTLSEKESRQAMVIRISGLTGQAIVYQPR